MEVVITARTRLKCLISLSLLTLLLSKTMKNITFTLLLLLSLGYISRAQDNTTSKQQDNPNAPEINFNNELHDYGTIKQGADGSCEFTFKNTGIEPLIISNARGSCGCTVPTWPKEPITKGQTAT